MSLRRGWAVVVLSGSLLAACGGGSEPSGQMDSGPGPGPGSDATGTVGGGEPVRLGDRQEGQFNLGPVEWSEATWHNSCSPYPAEVQQLEVDGLEGVHLAGVSNAFNGGGQLCDACIEILTGTGRQLVARVVTTGVTQAPGDVDLSPEAFAALDTGEYPRSMSWQLVSCPTRGAISYQFQTGANPYWTSLWVRNPRLPVTSLDVKSANHADWFALQRGGDGTFTDAGGFGEGAFTLRVTAQDGTQVTDDFPAFEPGGLMTGGQL